MSTKSTESVIAYFEDVSLAPTSLRIDGLIKPFTDWDHVRRACILVTDQQLLEVKRRVALTRAFILAHNRGKWSDKFSAVEIIVDHIYFLPLPLTPSNTLSELTTMATTVVSGTSTPTTTPVKKARLTAIDLD